MTWLELVHEEAEIAGWSLTDRQADYILYEYTGYPSFWESNNPAECCRRQVKEYFATAGVPLRPDAPTVWDLLAGVD